MQTLYDRPDLYDVIAPHDPTLEAFYLSRARERGGRVLDLACGSGRLSIPLARAGFKVTAADLSGAMLQRARQAAAGVEVEFAELDMRDFDLPGRTFETIIVAMNSILHVQSLEDFRGFFQSVARHLAPCGRLAFDAFVPSVALLGSSPEQRHPVGDGVHEALGRVSVDETIRYDPLTQISHVDWYWSTAAEKDFWRTPMQMRQIFPQEMPLLIASGGMRLVERLGTSTSARSRRGVTGRFASARRHSSGRPRSAPRLLARSDQLRRGGQSEACPPSSARLGTALCAFAYPTIRTVS